MRVTLADIEAARRTIAGHVLHTPMLPAPRLSALSTSRRAHGVIAMSAGNHAQALAYHAARLGIPATIVMPVTTPFVKVEATQAHGAEVLLEGETLVEAQARAEAIARERGLTLVHPYDDPLVIAGQGTIALEMLEGAPDLEMLVIPVGGGGTLGRPADRDHRRRSRALSVGLECLGGREPAVRRRHAGRRHCGQECRRVDASHRQRARRRARAGRRGASRARRQCVS